MLSGIALCLCVQVPHAAGRYVSVGIGYGGESVDASTVGVNHPTRCDSLLYRDPQDAPSDAACTDTTPREMFGGSFDLGAAFVGTASIGYAWDRWRIEAELLGRSHDGQTVPAIAGTDNQALLGKQSEWSAHSSPQYRVTDFNVTQLFVNAHYAFPTSSAWSPVVGFGIGLARVAADYTGSYLRRTVAEGYVAAAGGDPAQPAEWQLAAAGSLSLVDVDVNDQALGYQLFAGLDRALSERATLFVMARWSGFREVSRNDLWTTVRSHAPTQADGVTPFRTDQTIEGIGGFAATVGLRHAF